MMNDYTNPFVVAAAAPATRADFYKKTYLLVAVACAVFGLLLAGTLATPAIVNPLTSLFFGKNGGFGWLLVLGGFWLISMFANRLAFGGISAGTQLAGLGIYIVAEVLLFAPMLNILMLKFGQATLSEIVAPAALSTLLLAGGLTATVFMTKTDFSFLRAFVTIGFFVSIGAILLVSLFGSGIGVWGIIALTVFISVVILYQTWVVKTQFRPEQYVGAALIIFAGIATLFWYMVMLFAERRD